MTTGGRAEKSELFSNLAIYGYLRRTRRRRQLTIAFCN